MSIALHASPINSSNTIMHVPDNSSKRNIIAQRRAEQMGTNTFSGTNGDKSSKVSRVLNNIHDHNPDEDSDEDSEYGIDGFANQARDHSNTAVFNSPPQPISTSIDRAATQNIQQHDNYTTSQPGSVRYDQDPRSLHTNYMNPAFVSEYQQSIGINGSNNIHGDMTESKQDVLLNKLNYMINLLEEQQDARTNNVTEEIVMYSFLGIFVIFVVDSFVKVGKYVR